MAINNNAYRVRIFDKEYYDSIENKDELDDKYNLASPNTFGEQYPKTNAMLKKQQDKLSEIGFYVNREYVAIIDILDIDSFKIRKLTKSEIEEAFKLPGNQGKIRVEFSRLNSEQSFAELIPAIESNTISAEVLNNPFKITHVYQPNLNSVEQIINIKYDSTDPQSLEYIAFKTQINAKDLYGILATDDGRNNPELSQQSFNAKIYFSFDPEMELDGIKFSEVNDNNFIELK